MAHENVEKNSDLKLLSIDEVDQVKDFDCGNEDLNQYLIKHAHTNHHSGISRTSILFEKDQIIGYFSISNYSIPYSMFSSKLRYSLSIPKYDIPRALIGKLACSVDKKGNGFGKLLLAKALKKILKISSEIGIVAVIVDAIDEKAFEFYEYSGFTPFRDSKSRLFLTIRDLDVTMNSI